MYRLYGWPVGVGWRSGCRREKVGVGGRRVGVEGEGGCRREKSGCRREKVGVGGRRWV